MEEPLQLVPLGTAARKGQKEKPVKQAGPQPGPGSCMGAAAVLVMAPVPRGSPGAPTVPTPAVGIHALTQQVLPGCWALEDSG